MLWTLPYLSDLVQPVDIGEGNYNFDGLVWLVERRGELLILFQLERFFLILKKANIYNNAYMYKTLLLHYYLEGLSTSMVISICIFPSSEVIRSEILYSIRPLRSHCPGMVCISIIQILPIIRTHMHEYSWLMVVHINHMDNLQTYVFADSETCLWQIKM